MNMMTRRAFLPAGIASIASLFAINGVSAQEVFISSPTTLGVRVVRYNRHTRRDYGISGQTIKIIDINGYCPYQKKTDYYGWAKFDIPMIRGIDTPVLLYGTHHISLKKLPPWGFFVFRL